MTKEAFSKIVSSIPHQPGCYKYYDQHKELLYVGKAKDLRKRVSSYFNKNLDNYKTTKLVSLIAAIDFTVTDTEHESVIVKVGKDVVTHTGGVELTDLDIIDNLFDNIC